MSWQQTIVALWFFIGFVLLIFRAVKIAREDLSEADASTTVLALLLVLLPEVFIIWTLHKGGFW